MALPTSGDDGSSTSQSVTPSPIILRPKRKKNLTPADEVIKLAGEQLRNIRPDDEFEAYGKYVAHKLRSLKGSQAIFARKLINDVIFEGELEALTKDFKVMNSQPHHSFESRDSQQFNPQMYNLQPYPSPYIPPIPEHQLSHSQVPYPLQHNSRSSSSSNNILQLTNPTTFSQTLNYTAPQVSSITAVTNAPTNNPEQRYSGPVNTHPSESQLADSQDLTNSKFKSSSVNINSSQSMDNNVSTFFSNFSD